jgi:hypothetical protein
MKCHLQHDPIRNRIEITLWNEAPDGIHVYRPGREYKDQFELITQGATTEPSLVLLPQALEELVRASRNVVAASDATAYHLDDTIEIRDRMIDMVEKLLGDEGDDDDD